MLFIKVSDFLNSEIILLASYIICRFKIYLSFLTNLSTYLQIHRKIVDSWKYNSKNNIAIMYYSFCIGNVPIFWREKCNLIRKAKHPLQNTKSHPTTSIKYIFKRRKKLYYNLQIFLKTHKKVYGTIYFSDDFNTRKYAFTVGWVGFAITDVMPEFRCEIFGFCLLSFCQNERT